MDSRRSAPVTGWGLCIALLMTAMVVVSSSGCSREPNLGFSKSTPATPEELLAELKDHQEKIDKATEDMLQRINQFNQSRQGGQRTIQFSEIFGQDFSDQQKDVLNQMITQEKDVSYKSILQQIVSDRDAIQGLQEKVMHLEQSLPDRLRRQVGERRHGDAERRRHGRRPQPAGSRSLPSPAGEQQDRRAGQGQGRDHRCQVHTVTPSAGWRRRRPRFAACGTATR